jgi:uncharacterized protein YjbI with pentapeptide repeats
MANKKHLEILGRGVNAWNKWREYQSQIQPFLHTGNYGGEADFIYPPDLSQANLANAKLKGIDFKNVNLIYSDLSRADLAEADLYKAGISNTNFRGSNLYKASLIQADSIESDFTQANLTESILIRADFSRARLDKAILKEAVLGKADLTDASLKEANLEKAKLIRVQAFGANFQRAILTGACIQDWNISDTTNFDQVICEYVFRAYDKSTKQFIERLPINQRSILLSGEFELWAKVRSSALETIDITFIDGINWLAFFRTLQEVRQQHPDANIVVKAIQEEKGGFAIRLWPKTELTGTALESLKASIEPEFKAFYPIQLAEARGEIRALERSLNDATEKLAMTSKYTIHGDIGNLADVNWGNMTATINNNYGAKADDIIQLLTSLKETAQDFPDEEKEAALDCVNQTEAALAQPQPNPTKLKTRIVSLLTVAIALGGTVATATDFANNVLELSSKLSIPPQALQPQLMQLQQLHPDVEWSLSE